MRHGCVSQVYMLNIVLFELIDRIPARSVVAMRTSYSND